MKRVGVAEPLLYLLDVATGVEEEGGAGVAERVEAHRRALAHLRFALLVFRRDLDVNVEPDGDGRGRQDAAVDVGGVNGVPVAVAKTGPAAPP